jgi:hypothetical protein
MPSAACKKKTKTQILLRDPATLPHVSRRFPKMTSTIAFKNDGITEGLLHCYMEGLARDPMSAGTFHVTAVGDAARGPIVTVQWKDTVLDKAARFCVEAGLNDWHGIDVAPGSRAEGDVTLTSYAYSEAAPPGWAAYGKVVERRVRGAPVRVLGVTPERPLDESVMDGKRVISGDVKADLEITEDGIYELCGEISDFEVSEGGRRGAPCPKVKHLKTDKISALGWISFTLEPPDGWADGEGHHWFGDEPREIEQ